MAINARGSVLFDLRAFNSDANPITSVSVYIGSADPYNFIDVLGTDGNGALDAAHPLLTIGGANLPGDNGDWYSSLANGRLDAGHGDRQDAARYFAVDECSAGGVRSSRLSQDRALFCDAGGGHRLSVARSRLIRDHHIRPIKPSAWASLAGQRKSAAGPKADGAPASS